MTTAGALRQRFSGIGPAWQRFWFQREPIYALGVVRIAFGAITVMWTLWLLPLLDLFYGPGGPVPRQPSIPWTWGLFAHWDSHFALLIAWAILLVSAIALTVGWHSRLAAVLVFVLIMSFQRRDPYIINSGDVVMRIEALFLAVSPVGSALSLDQRRKTGVFWSAQTRPIWPVRLLQVQMSIIYLFSVQTKLAGETWLQGTATSYALRLKELERVAVPEWFSTNAVLMNLMAWSTLAIELGLAIMVWNRRWRPWVLGAGVILHVSIDATLLVGIFSFAMFVLYLSWLSPATVERLPDTFKQLPAKARALLKRRKQPDGSTPLPQSDGHRIADSAAPSEDRLEGVGPRSGQRASDNGQDVQDPDQEPSAEVPDAKVGDKGGVSRN